MTRVRASIWRIAVAATMVLLLVPLLVLVMIAIRRHCDRVERSLAVDWVA